MYTLYAPLSGDITSSPHLTFHDTNGYECVFIPAPISDLSNTLVIDYPTNIMF